MASARNVTAARHAAEFRHTVDEPSRRSRHSRPTRALPSLPDVVAALRARLAEVWRGVRARPLASPAVLLAVAAVVTTAAATHPAALGSPRIAPAAHTTPRAGGAEHRTAQAPVAAAPAPQCTVPAPPAVPAGVTDEQVANARVIAQVGYDRGLPDRAVVVSLATSLQESELININYGDRDSLGLFQQRPSQGWGAPDQVQDPAYAAGQFYDRLVQVPGWDSGRLTDVAQAVQRSGFPEAYQQWEGLATGIAAAVKPVAQICG
jgi:hypothetical protein